MRFFITVLLFTGMVISNSAWAHADLNSTTPADGAILKESPAVLELSFSAPVRLVKLTLQDSTDKDIALDIPANSKGEAQYSIALPELALSHYTVSWIAMGEDGHKMSGNWTFTFQDDARTKAQ